MAFMHNRLRGSTWIALLCASLPAYAQVPLVVTAELTYRAPGRGPKPDFSPKGTQIKLTDLPSDAPLPEGSTRPAKTGIMEVGPGPKSWIAILATADAAHPRDLCRL